MTSLPSDGDSILLFNINTSRRKSNFLHAHKLGSSLFENIIQLHSWSCHLKVPVWFSEITHIQAKFRRREHEEICVHCIMLYNNCMQILLLHHNFLMIGIFSSSFHTPIFYFHITSDRFLLEGTNLHKPFIITNHYIFFNWKQHAPLI